MSSGTQISSASRPVASLRSFAKIRGYAGTASATPGDRHDAAERHGEETDFQDGEADSWGAEAGYQVPFWVMKSHTTGCSSATRANVGTNSATAGWRRP